MITGYSNQDDFNYGRTANMTAKFRMALGIPAQDARRAAIIADLWFKGGFCRRSLMQCFHIPRDLKLMQQMPATETTWPSGRFLQNPHINEDQMRSALQWLFGKSGVKFDLVDLVNTAAGAGNTAALAWLYDHVDEEHLRAATPVRHATSCGRSEVLRWLHENIGIPCKHNCPVPSTARRLPCDSLDGNVAWRSKFSVEVIDWLYSCHPCQTLESFISNAVCNGRQDLLQWTRNHATDDAWMLAAFQYAVKYGETALATQLIDERSNLADEVPAEVWREVVDQAVNRDDVAMLDWLATHQPRAFRALEECLLQEWWSPNSLEWFARHPEHAPWPASEVSEDEPLPEWVFDSLDSEIEMHGVSHRPPASRALYVILCADNMLAYKERYFVTCAARRRDVDWLVEIGDDYELDLPEFVSSMMDDWFGPGDDNGFPFFIELVERSVKVVPAMLDGVLEQDNHAGALWIMERLDPADNWNIGWWKRHRGHLGLLQLACSRGQRLCRNCITEGAERHDQHQILRWMRQPAQQSADIWTGCTIHKQ
ncbi:hypothetical protein RI367_007076 [Sorochytrium milnesiophthora]